MNKSPLLITVDVGNTATSTGVFRATPATGSPLPLSVWTLSTPDLRKRGFYRQKFLKYFQRRYGVFPNIKAVLVSSVVPPMDRPLRAQLKRLFRVSPHFVSAKTPSRVKIKYRNPIEVGADRLVNARAAWAWVRGPSIVVDFGTATTFDCISARGEYLGGVIAPGPLISAEALYKKTAKLPLVLLKKPALVMGRNTLESIQSGLYHGYRGLVKEVVDRLKKRLGKKTKVIATGGQARWILDGLGVADVFRPHLTMTGLYHLWRDIIESH